MKNPKKLKLEPPCLKPFSPSVAVWPEKIKKVRSKILYPERVGQEFKLHNKNWLKR